jgi:hypothetical protein
LSQLVPLIGKKYYGNDSFLRAIQAELGKRIGAENQSELLNFFLDEQAETATIRFAEEIALEIKSILRIGSTQFPQQNELSRSPPVHQGKNSAIHFDFLHQFFSPTLPV